MVGLGLAAALVVLPIHENRGVVLARQHWLPRSSGRRIALLAITLGSLGLGLGFIVQLLPLWFHLRFHVGEDFLGPPYGAGQVLALAALALATPLSRRMGAVPFVVLTQTLASLTLVLMAFVPTVSLAVVLWILRPVMMNSSWPVQQAYIMGVVDPGERASASSLTYGAWSIASALTPPIGGALLAAHLYSVPFLLGAVCYAIAIGVFYACFRNVPVSVEPEETEGYAPAVGD
jgi:MFS family permease